MKFRWLNSLLAYLLLTASWVYAPPAVSEEQINAVDGTPQGFMVAVGNHGTIVHFQPGQEARIVPSPTDRDLLDVSVASPEFAVAVGAGIVLRWDGVSWSPVSVESTSMRYSKVWAAPDLSLVLYGGSVANAYRVCPWVPGAETQPFCRHFTAPMLGACERGDEVQLVLANGEIYRVNNALIGSDGGFEPAFRPDTPTFLKAAWLPDTGCPAEGVLAEVFAIGVQGDLLHFNGAGWRPVNKLPRQCGAKRLNPRWPVFAFAELARTHEYAAKIRLASFGRRNE